MKKYKAVLLALSVLACSGAVPAPAAEYAVGKEPVIKGAAHPPGEALVKDITQRAAPSVAANVDILAPLTGTWNYTATVWTGPDDAKPYQAQGRIENEMIMDNRFLASTEIGGLNMGGLEIPVKSQGWIGYDNAQKSFTSVWIGTLSTGMMIGHGTFDKKDNVIKETGRFTNPVNGAQEDFISELRFVDTDHYSRTIYVAEKSVPKTKLMEFEYSKRK